MDKLPVKMTATHIVEELAKKGFLVLPNGDPRAVANALGHSESSELLIPRTRGESRPRTHSATVGYDAFPWHTDGAVALYPPDWLVLRGVRFVSPTWTELVDPPIPVVRLLSRTVLRAQPGSGRARYFPAHLPSTRSTRSRVRWDESKCRPNRADIGETVRQLRPTACVTWHESQILVIDNARLLHRRPAVVDKHRAIERIYVWERH